MSFVAEIGSGSVVSIKTMSNGIASSTALGD
jgi:hypothetical protein